MANIQDLISRGYFPRELPPPFQTSSMGQCVAQNAPQLPIQFGDNQLVTKPAVHNLARKGGLRRRLGIPNPVSFYQLASFCTQHWNQLQQDCQRGTFSETRPIENPAPSRLFTALESLRTRPHRRAQVRRSCRFLVTADINRFYHSIYTHSIPWAIHTKAVAKQQMNNMALRGNALDKLIRRGQDKQTYGIPIGPDTSLLVAELILCAVDERLHAEGVIRGFRHIDDYELGFRSAAEAERGLAILQEALREYELELNPRKTRIVELPQIIESPAISQIRAFAFRADARAQESDLLRFFNLLFELESEHSDEGVLRFGISKLRGTNFAVENHSLLQNLALQAALVDGGVLGHVISLFSGISGNGGVVAPAPAAEAFNEIVRRHAPLGHGHEVAWSLWGLLLLNQQLEDDAATAAARCGDSVAGLLLLHARALGLVGPNVDVTPLALAMIEDELRGEQWLLAYEALVQGWLPSQNGQDYVAQSATFSFLNANGVRFYDVNSVAMHQQGLLGAPQAQAAGGFVAGDEDYDL